MNVRETAIPGVLEFEPRIFGDERGFFAEIWQRDRYAQYGLTRPFVQDNLSSSRKGVLRGLHLQNPYPQGKLVHVLEGEVFDVAVDLRRGSPYFGQWVGVRLDARRHNQLWVPEGFAHGFCVLSDKAVFAYKCTDVYRPETEVTVRWDDPFIGVDWPLEVAPIVSDKDRRGEPLNDIDPVRLPAYEP